MHRQVSSLPSAGGSPGKLGQLGTALGDAGLSIQTIGGAEWKHFGPVVFVLHEDRNNPDDQLVRLSEIMQELQIPWALFRTVHVELEDKEGQLGAVGNALGEATPPINVFTINVSGRHGNDAEVQLGVMPGDVRRAVATLVAAGFDAPLEEHPDETPDDGVSDPPSWWDRWDDRTAGFADLWDDPNVAPDDPRFWQP
jgi:hypothetical protein